MATSLLAVVQTTPQIEPLPVYRRDPETSSIRSSAPSYVSEAPTYHSTVPTAPAAQRTGLPPANYAPGFHHIRAYDRAGLSHLNFSINQWSSVYSSPQARHYHNVAARRTDLAMIEEQALMTTLVNQIVFPSFTPSQPLETATLEAQPAAPSPSIPSTIHTTASAPSTHSVTAAPTPSLSFLPSNNETIPPLEDPDLVGTAAATVARERRLYMTRELQRQRQRDEAEAHALREESKRWDFLLAQMSDWNDREQSWKAFSKKMATRNKGSSGKRVLFRFWK